MEPLALKRTVKLLINARSLVLFSHVIPVYCVLVYHRDVTRVIFY